MGVAIRFRSKYVILLSCGIFLCFTLLMFTQTRSNKEYKAGSSRKLTWDSSSELNVKLKKSQIDVPVIIVDEHNEVIPYWYKAVEQGIIRSKRNTLIHIDGHSDMATPEEYEQLKSFEHRVPSRDSMFLPLMQSNDVFIISAILKGLISHVVWVQPSWNIGSNHTSLMRAYVGTYAKNKDEEIICECLQRNLKHSTREPYECSYINREKEDADVSISADQCHKLRAFTYIVVSETKFVRLVDIRKVKNLFVDIDEDYFGVESGVQNFIDIGVSLKTQNLVNEVLHVLYCPTSIEVEQILNRELRAMFAQMSVLIERDKRDDTIHTFNGQLIRRTKSYTCATASKSVHEEAAILFSSISSKEINALSKIKYCLQNSPRLMSPSSEFSICHGTIYPSDTLNQIYMGPTDEIRARGKRLENMLHFIYNHTQPRFFTISRSLRDGYTPRSQQKFIESTILKSLDEVFQKHGLQKRLLYDPYLVFGSEGWT